MSIGQIRSETASLSVRMLAQVLGLWLDVPVVSAPWLARVDVSRVLCLGDANKKEPLCWTISSEHPAPSHSASPH
jgi:hypothetical protein